jgi:hypothetical protein
MMNGKTQITGDAWGDDLDTRLQRATELCRIASKALTEITDQCNSGVAGATPWYIGAAYLIQRESPAVHGGRESRKPR